MKNAIFAKWGAIAQEIAANGPTIAPAAAVVSDTTQGAETQASPISAAAIDSILYDAATLKPAKKKSIAQVIDESEPIESHQLGAIDDLTISWDFA